MLSFLSYEVMEEQRKVMLISRDLDEKKKTSFALIFSIFFIKETIVNNFYLKHFLI